MRKTSFFKRSLAALLSFVMILGMFPVLGGGNIALEAEAAPAEGTDYITMPITIRDFAADGMLFEYNETGNSGIAYKGTTNPTIPVYRSKSFSQTGYNHSYAYVREYDQKDSNGDYFDVVDPETNEWWHVIFVNSDGSINRVYPKGTPTADPTIPEWGMVIYAYEGCNNYNYFAGITDSTKANYSFDDVVDDSSTAGAYIKCTKHEAVYHQADTKGFGMLYTQNVDIRDEINIWDTTSGAITGSIVIYNNSTLAENSATTETAEGFHKGFNKYTDSNEFVHYYPYQAFGLWDNDGGYANQYLINGSVRTNLVQRYLVDGKPIYTNYAVKWIAEYLKLALSADWQNADGSYNTFFVTGDEVADGKTLAERIRVQMAQHNDAMGTYTDSYNKFFQDGKATGNLDHYTEIETWYDAAFYLLHSTWRDSEEDKENPGNDGYGKLAPEYHSLHLVAKEVAGKTTYVFNSMYDNAVYNPTTGEIYNTQIATYTPALESDGVTEGNADGNPQPVARFDPLGKYGTGSYRGYGIPSPDTYGDMITDSTANWADYYDTTNYHLSLEGHAQFVYYEDDDLYFTFTGDDDVYLYINGVRVLDIGGAHSIAKVSISLNDVAAVCGLKDGQAYPFDFFYMERHGTAANFGIETNIQLAESAMTTTKTGYQNGSTTGYNGFVDPDTKVAYSFALENNGNAPIYNLAFDDPSIGVYFGHDKVEVNEEYTDIENEMYLYRFNADGSVKSSVPAGSLTVQKIKDELKAGLPMGETIAIYGFKYMIDAYNDWEGDTFTNTVHSYATSTENGTTPDLTGKADWKVRKTNEQLNKFHVYDWLAQKVSKNPAVQNGWYQPEGYEGVTVTVQEILERTGVNLDNYPNAKVVPCTASGNVTEHNLNPNITLNKEGGQLVSLTYRSTIPGVDQVYYKITGVDGIASLVFNYRVFTFGAVDNIYVLDYGLNVELNGENFGLLTNDHLNVVGANVNVTTIGISEAEGQRKNGQYVYGPLKSVTLAENDEVVGLYGNFVYGTKTRVNEETEENENYISLMYEPQRIINNTDGVIAHVQVRESGNHEGEDLKFYGVDMYEVVTTAPANVVYYEDNFPGITYVEKNGNDWVQYETWVDGKPVTGTEQSANQDSSYGSDPNYGADKDGTWETVPDTTVPDDSEVTNSTSFNLDTTDLNAYQKNAINFLNNYLGLAGSDSNGTVKELVVKATKEDVMYFEFEGTGFEIVSRTTDNEYAIINVQVYKKNADETYTFVKQKAVFTESKGGDLYQVPIISITGLERDNYKVVVQAAKYGNVNRVLYIDGIRIYGALRDNEALEYYNPEEARAEFIEVKQLIQDGQAIYADASGTGENAKLVTGQIMVESDIGVLKIITDVNQYLSIGPNNELYLSGNNNICSAFIFWLKPKEFIDDTEIPYPENARTLEIGAHRKSNSLIDIKGPVRLKYGSTTGEIINGVNQYDVNSATEMYYTIDVSKLTTYDEKLGYLVMIGTNGSDIPFDTLALTSIKVAGYDISFAQDDIKAANDEGDVKKDTTVRQTFNLLREQLADLKKEPEIEQVPVNENLSIRTAGLMADKVSPGKYATLTVRAGLDADKLVVKDADGNVVEPLYNIRSVRNGEAVFTFLWQINGSSGDVQKYTARVYDAAGLASVNAETVTVTVY